MNEEASILKINEESKSPRKRGSPTKTASQIQTSVFEESSSNRFIKLFGRGPKDSGEGKLHQLLYSKMIVEPGTILQPRRNPAAPEILDPDELIDIMDAKETEEPFTLEIFDELVKMHMEKGKDFIIARVTTVDPQDPERYYYSYYAAHHINKILFRTQPDQGLLHRMRAKNPLNNMTIVGDVHYYVIKHSDALVTKNSRRRSFETIQLKSPIKTTSILPFEDKLVSPNISRLLGFEQPKTLHLMMKPEALEPSNPVITKIQNPRRQPKRMDSRSSRRNSADDAYSDPPTPKLGGLPKKSLDLARLDDSHLTLAGSTESEDAHRKVRSMSYHNNRDGARDVKEWVQLHSKLPFPKSQVQSLPRKPTRRGTRDLEDQPVSPTQEGFWEARYYASDDDYLMQASIRKYFRENALESTDAILFSIPASENEPSQLNGMTPHPTLSNFVFAYTDSQGNTRGITAAGVRWLMIAFVIVGTVLLRIFVDQEWFYLGLFLLLLSITLVLLLLI